MTIAKIGAHVKTANSKGGQGRRRRLHYIGMNRGGQAIKWAIIAAAAFTLFYILDLSIFGGIRSGISYGLWSLQYQWRLVFWIPMAMLVAGMGPAIYLFLRARQLGKDYRKHREEERYYKAGWAAFAIGAVLSILGFAALGYLMEGDRKMATLKEAQVRETDKPIAIQPAGFLPQGVAKQRAELKYSRSNYKLGMGNLTRNCQREWVWTFLQIPGSTARGQIGGVVEVPASKDGAREVRIVNQNFRYGPEVGVRGSLLYQLRRQVEAGASAPDPLGIIGCDGKAYIVAPIMSWKKAGVTRAKMQSGALVLNGEGELKHYSISEANRQPLLKQSGRIISRQQALSVAQAYRYKLGRQNQSRGLLGFIAPGEQRSRFDVIETSTRNPQPFLSQSEDGRTFWVTLMSPYRSGKQARAIMYTDASSGTSTIYKLRSGAIVSPDQARKIALSEREEMRQKSAAPGETRLSVGSQGQAYYLTTLLGRPGGQVAGAVLINGSDGQVKARYSYQKPQPNQGKTIQLKTQLSPGQMEILLRACRKVKSCRSQLLN